jgi:ligand-binding sensor domain-containing protein
LLTPLQFESARASISSDIEFQHISTDIGLSQKTVLSMYQDSLGFVWIGTQEGLNRYDGREIRVFTNSANDPSSLSSNVVRAIIEDSKGYLWIATSNGLNRINKDHQTFQRIELKTLSGQQVKKLYSLAIIGGNTLLVGTDGNGVFRLNTDLPTPKASPLAELSELSTADVRVIFEDTRNRIWFGTDGKGVWVTGRDYKTLTKFSADGKQGSISHNRIRAIKEDTKGQIWLGTRGGGLNQFDERTKLFSVFKNDKNNLASLSNNRVYSIVEDSERRLWIATDGGVNLLEQQAGAFIRVQHHTSQKRGLSHNRVLSLLESDNGLIWLGTMSGLDLWNPVTAKFAHYRNISEDKNSLSNNTVYSFAESRKNELYVATFGGGLNKFSFAKNKWEVVSSSPSNKDLQIEQRLTSLMVDNDKNIWIGGFSSGVSVITSNHERLLQFKNEKESSSSLSANGITDMYQDSDNTIWIATYAAGLNKLNQDNNSFTRYQKSKNQSGLQSNSVLQILEDDEGYIWLATDGGGISRLNKSSNEILTFTHDADEESSLSGNVAWSIFQDSRGRFWVGTQGQGLNRWEPENRRNGRGIFQHYSEKDGLASGTINGVLEDDQGNIWVSTNKGVSKIDPHSNKISNYNLASEIHDNELNLGAMTKSSDGRLYFGGLNGVSAFYPEQITSNLNKPRVVLTDILSENKSISIDKSASLLTEIEFSHKDYLITFEFAALDYSQPEKNQYQYKLEGFDPEWIDSKNLNRATYTNLPSGQYLLKVKGSNNDGLWSDESINLPVTILPAPWATWWAFTIYSIIFCGFLILLIRSQAKRIANQDLFKQQVINEIESSTRSIELENRSLRKQLKNYEINSANDIETGLPNQTFFTEQVLISLALLKKQSKLNPKLKMFCAILSVKSNDNNTSQLVSKLAEQLSKTDNQIHLVARWNKNELALLGFADSQESLKRTINSIEQAFIDSQGTDSTCEHSLGYTINPLNRMDNYPFKWDNVLMITEHAARIASGLSDKNCIGLLACHQSLSSTTIKSIMSDSSLQSLKEKFDVTTH